MANKNQKQLRARMQRAIHKGERAIEHLMPVRDYHNHDRSAFVTQHIPLPHLVGNVNSANRERNMCQRILINKDSFGVSDSLTVHEPLNSILPVQFPNHKYISYRKAGG